MRNKSKKEHSIMSNIFYFLSILFKISPALVIGEALWGVILNLPTKLVSILGVKYIIDVITNGESYHKVFIAVGIIAAVLLFGELIAWLFREFFWNTEKEKVYKGLNTKLYNKAKSLDLESYDNPEFYNNFILTIESSSENIQNILNLVRRYVGEFISLLTICAIVFTIDPICLLIIGVIVVIFTPISKKIGNLQMQRRIENNKYHRRADYFARIFYLQDYAKEVRMNNIKPLLMKRYNQAADDVIENQKKYVAKIDAVYFVQETGVQILGFMLVLPLYLGYCVIKTNTLSAGDFVATFNSSYSIATAFSFLTVGVVRNFSEQAKMIEKYRTFLNEKNKIFDGEKTAEITKPKTIEIKDLSFTYPGNDKPTLNNINLTIKPYEKIALVGYNGAGKTTLTNLLLRLYDATDGKILIDGEDIRNCTVNSHRSRFATVFQDFQIFSCSISENVALDINPDISRVRQALKHSGFTKELPNDMDTELLREFDDNGIMMSGGESQNVAIARAFYKNCPYIILD
ncbi:MAG: ABC transporter ATP-binding protein/permease, partial [Eubacterium sp.]|nr:ABC transporter ATP-binding protein/permease [Eubacterium sp.]